MERKILIGTMLILILLTAFPYAVFGQDDDGDEELLRLHMNNQTDQIVRLVLEGMENPHFYSLSVPAGTSRTFTVVPGDYASTTFSCGESSETTLNVSSQLRLNFTECPGESPNAGEPTLEKIHLRDTPEGLKWHFQYGVARGENGGTGNGTGGRGCQVTAASEVTIYHRPSFEAEVFSTQGPGFEFQISARTADGWLGFDPGVAQAANIGPFRLRWLPPGTQTQTGNCNNAPVTWAPPPGICFFMPMENSRVRATPAPDGEILAVLHFEEFAAILGLSPDGEWGRVDLGPGNTGLDIEGWVDRDEFNVNGPCNSLPTVNP